MAKLSNKIFFKEIPWIQIKFHENSLLFPDTKEIPENEFSMFFQVVDTLDSLSLSLLQIYISEINFTQNKRSRGYLTMHRSRVRTPGTCRSYSLRAPPKPAVFAFSPDPGRSSSTSSTSNSSSSSSSNSSSSRARLRRVHELLSYPQPTPASRTPRARLPPPVKLCLTKAGKKRTYLY